MAIHFKTSKERLDYLKGKYKEVIPVEVKPKEVEEKPKKQSKGKKKDDGKVQAK